MAANRLQLYDYAGGKCPFCGRGVADSLSRYGTVDRQFEFNHINPARKHPDYDNLIRRNLSTEQLDEIDKCVLLCRCCHGLYHAQNISAKAVLTHRIGDTRRQQTFRAGGLIDWKDRRVALFSDQHDRLALFSVQLLGQSPLLRVRRDLDRELFSVFIPATLHYGSLVVRDQSRIPLFLVDRVSRSHYRIVMDVRCPFAELELHSEPGEPVVWVRNGRMLTADGEVQRRGIITMEGLKYSECPKP